MVSGRRAPGARRIVLAGATTAVVTVLLFDYPTSTGVRVPPGSSLLAGPAQPVPGASGPLPPVPDASPSTGPRLHTGDPVSARWGLVQVRITVTDGRVVAADAVRTPDAYERSVRVNARAVPVLNAEAVAAQSADVDVVSGATLTSLAYATSLQAALDAADL